MSEPRTVPPAAVCGLPSDLQDLVVPRLEQALAGLELGAELAGVTVWADDLPGPDAAWLRWERGRLPGPPALTVFCHADVFLKRRPATSTVFPQRPVWEQRPAPVQDLEPAASEFSAERADMFLRHHLLLARDILRKLLDPDAVGAAWSAAFSAAWAATIDGRLERLRLPGYPLTERRGAFSRVFSAAGVLMPEHWRLFQELWDGDLAGQDQVLQAVRLLPHL